MVLNLLHRHNAAAFSREREELKVCYLGNYRKKKKIYELGEIMDEPGCNWWVSVACLMLCSSMSHYIGQNIETFEHGQHHCFALPRRALRL